MLLIEPSDDYRGPVKYDVTLDIVLDSRVRCHLYTFVLVRLIWSKQGHVADMNLASHLADVLRTMRNSLWPFLPTRGSYSRQEIHSHILISRGV